jgi:hypothetical protein
MHHKLQSSKKEKFGDMVDDVITNREILIMGDLNAQTGSDRMGYEQGMGSFSDGNRNEEGERLIYL